MLYLLFARLRHPTAGAWPGCFVSVDVLVTEIQKQLHLLAHGGRRQDGVEQDVLTLLAHFRAQRPIMGLWEFCTWLRVLIGADMRMATVQGLSGQAAGASPRAYGKDIFKERPAQRGPLVKEEDRSKKKRWPLLRLSRWAPGP